MVDPAHRWRWVLIALAAFALGIPLAMLLISLAPTAFAFVATWTATLPTPLRHWGMVVAEWTLAGVLAIGVLLAYEKRPARRRTGNDVYVVLAFGTFASWFERWTWGLPRWVRRQLHVALVFARPTARGDRLRPVARWWSIVTTRAWWVRRGEQPGITRRMWEGLADSTDVAELIAHVQSYRRLLAHVSLRGLTACNLWRLFSGKLIGREIVVFFHGEPPPQVYNILTDPDLAIRHREALAGPSLEPRGLPQDVGPWTAGEPRTLEVSA